MSGRILPVTSRGNAASITRNLKGTDKAIWAKYLKVFHKNTAKDEDEWNKIIEKAGKMKAKAYA